MGSRAAGGGASAETSAEEHEPLLGVQQEDRLARLQVQMRVRLLLGAPLLGQTPVRLRLQGAGQAAADEGQPGHRRLEAREHVILSCSRAAFRLRPPPRCTMVVPNSPSAKPLWRPPPTIEEVAVTRLRKLSQSLRVLCRVSPRAV